MNYEVNVANAAQEKMVRMVETTRGAAQGARDRLERDRTVS